MSDSHSDALVFFGATGDLAYKKDFPRAAGDGETRASQRSGDRRRQERLEPRSASRASAGQRPETWRPGPGRLRETELDFCVTWTGTTAIRQLFKRSRKELNGAQRPAFYLAIPPLLFETVVEQLAKSGCAKGARIIVEKPFGHDLASARELNSTLHQVFPESSIFRIDHYLGQASGAECGGLPLCECFHGAVLESELHRERANHDGGEFRRRGARRFLRSDRRHSRRDPESSFPDLMQSCDGASGSDRQRIDSR